MSTFAEKAAAALARYANAPTDDKELRAALRARMHAAWEANQERMLAALGARGAHASINYEINNVSARDCKIFATMFNSGQNVAETFPLSDTHCFTAIYYIFLGLDNVTDDENTIMCSVTVKSLAPISFFKHV